MEDLLTEQQFIQRFKEKGFELYKTEEIEKKLREEWISVEDDMPEIGQFVLCIINNDKRYHVPFTTKYEREKYFRSDDDSADILDYSAMITHWMPLPKPPTE